MSKATASGTAYLPSGVLYDKGYLLEGRNRFDDATAVYDWSLAWLSTAPAGLETAKFKMRSGYCTGLVSDPAKGTQLLTEALELAEKLNAAEFVWRSLNNLGIISFNARAYGQALDYYQRQRTVAEECGDLEGVGKSLLNSANTRAQIKEYEGADEAYLRAIELFDRMGKQDACLSAKLGLVSTLFYRSRYAQSRRLCGEILETNRTVNDPALESKTCLMLAQIEFIEGRFADSLALNRRALGIGRRCGDKALQVTALNSMGMASLYRGDMADAFSYCEQGLAVARQVHPVYEGITLTNKSSVFFSQDRYQEAAALAGEAAAIAKKYGDNYGAATAIGNQGSIAVELGCYGDAKNLLDEALALFGSLQDERGGATIGGSLGSYHACIGEFEKALAFYRQAAETAQRLQDSAMTASLAAFLGRVYRETGCDQMAQRHFEQAIAESRRIGFQYLLAEALHDSADLCFSLGNFVLCRERNDEAAVIAGSIGRIELPFQCGVLNARLVARDDPGAALSQLEKLAQRHCRPEHAAEIAYQRYQIAPKDEQRRLAARLYADLLNSTPNFRYRRRLEELTGER